MQYEEQQLINGLFQRLKQTEQHNSQRDADAERHITDLVKQQPASPYYMAQSILIQEAALKRLQTRVQELETELAQQKNKQTAPGGGSFLGSLFGGGRNHNPPSENNWNAPPPQPAQEYPRPVPAASSRSGGFMAGALQTAAGVAGGVVLADMLTSMFHHSRPEEIVNIIEEPAMPIGDTPFEATRNNDFNDVSDTHFLDQNDPYGDDSGGYQDSDSGDYDDDDSFI